MTEFEVFLLYYCINNNKSSFVYFDFILVSICSNHSTLKRLLQWQSVLRIQTECISKAWIKSNEHMDTKELNLKKNYARFHNVESNRIV